MDSPRELEAVVQAAIGGATVLTGGGRLEGAGNYFAPTVLTDVDHSMLVMREETFGPTLPAQNASMPCLP